MTENEEKDQAKVLGERFYGHYISYLGLTQSRWIPPIYGTLKLNVDVTWDKGKITIAMIAGNHEGNVLGLWYNNYYFVSPLVEKLLAIQKAFLVLDNFLNHNIQVKNVSKTILKALLGLSLCP